MLKSDRLIGYELVGDTYQMKDFANGDIISIMSEVSILYDGRVCLLHGHPRKINARFRTMKRLYNKEVIEHDLHIVQGKIPIEEIDKMLSITGYLPKEIIDNYAS